MGEKTQRESNDLPSWSFLGVVGNLIYDLEEEEIGRTRGKVLEGSFSLARIFLSVYLYTRSQTFFYAHMIGLGALSVGTKLPEKQKCYFSLHLLSPLDDFGRKKCKRRRRRSV